MKKSFRVLIVVLIIAFSLAVSASAVNFTYCADKLNEIGLFSGTENGYELDRAATRAEAAVMLVRLLGAEEEALALTYDAPFTDLADWLKPYVQYLYKNKLTSGVSETSFNPSGLCNAQMYCTFLLRALGYSDADGDFTYAEAADKAAEAGLEIVGYDEEVFLRDYIAAMSYSALCAAPKDGEAGSLLEKLIADGAVAEDKSQEVLDLFNAYKAYIEAGTAMPDVTKIEVDYTYSLDYQADEESESMLMSMNYKLDLDDADDPKMIIDYTTSISYVGEVVETDYSYYFTDGVFYMNVDDTKIKMPFEIDEAITQIALLDDLPTINVGPLCFIKDISVEENVYTFSFTHTPLVGLLDSVFSIIKDLPEDIGNNLTVNNFVMQVTFGEDGYVSEIKITLSASIEFLGALIDIEVTQDMNIVATGDAVVIKFPADLDKYEEIGD